MASLFLFLFASISDYFDGALARKYNLSSQLGEVLDPIADKILVLFMLFALALYFSSIYIGFISCLILAREFWVSALRDLNARNLNTSATKVSFLAKIKTTIQLIAVVLYLLGLSYDIVFMLFLGDFVLFIALIIGLKTGLTYSLKTFSNFS
jgi:CDP-diacylglycerol--glycerol-3-phosphate 3-phosphatidyltransferase|tara:strand:+ start:1400 stop:1855 length:456 start_codon:yes stop_codon:yes gene_type:complete